MNELSFDTLSCPRARAFFRIIVGPLPNARQNLQVYALKYVLSGERSFVQAGGGF